MENEPSSMQLKLARDLGLEGIENMSARELHFAISAAPPTQEQKKFIDNLFAFLGRELPTALTYSTARSLLDNLVPLVNERVLMDEQWGEGDLLKWRDSYLLIETIHLDRSFTLVHVELQRAAQGEPLDVVRKRTNKKVHHPFTLHGHAIKIDPVTYQP